MSQLRNDLRGYAYVAPNFLGFALFTALPVLGAVLMSFHAGSFASRPDGQGGWTLDAEFVGIQHYTQLLGFRSVEVLGEVELERGERGVERLVVIREASQAPDDLVSRFKDPQAPVSLTCVEPHLLLFCGAATVREVRGAELKEVDDSPSAQGSLWQTRDPKFWWTLVNTLLFLVGIPLTMACSLGLALLLNQKIRGRVIYRTLLFLPSVATGVAMFLVWRWLYNPNVGLVNALLDSLWLIDPKSPPDWLGDPLLVRPAIILMGVFSAMGGTNMILFLAGLQGIDPQLYEAADIDGAGPWAKFRHVTWPGLRPTTFFILTTNLIGGFQMFDQAYVMTESGGPDGAAVTLVYYIYQKMFITQEMGYAAAIALVLFALVFFVTMLNWLWQRLTNPLARA